MDNINLLGSGDVRSAGINMQSAASDMMRAASIIDESLHQHRQFMEEWLVRFEQAVEKAVEEK